MAGCLGPSGLTSADRNGLGAKVVEELFRAHAGALIDGGVQAVLLQAFADPEELEIAIGAVRELHHLPVIALLASGREGTLPGGKGWEETVRKLRGLGQRWSVWHLRSGRAPVQEWCERFQQVRKNLWRLIRMLGSLNFRKDDIFTPTTRTILRREWRNFLGLV